METTPNQKKQLIAALEAFKKAADNLNEVWGNTQWINENGTELAEIPNRLYPFQESFDQVAYDVKLWVEDTTERINLFKPIQ